MMRPMMGGMGGMGGMMGMMGAPGKGMGGPGMGMGGMKGGMQQPRPMGAMGGGMPPRPMGMPGMGQTAPPPTGAQNPSSLANAPPGMQKQMLGEKIFPMIARIHPEMAGKITGMMLE